MKRKIEPQYTDWGYGFPVILHNVPMIKIDEEWTPDINYRELERAVLKMLAHKPARLTGNEVRFIRNFLGMTLEAFAARLGYTHPAVIGWEKKDDSPTGMIWSTEKDIRQELLLRLEGGKGLGEKMLQLYEELRQIAKDENTPLEQDCRKLAAMLK